MQAPNGAPRHSRGLTPSETGGRLQSGRSDISVVLHELDFHAAGLLKIRRVHAGEVLSMRCLSVLHSRCDKARVRRVDIVSTKSQMAQVNFAIIRLAQLDLETRAGVNDHSKEL
jgi:hypothetical protein